MCGICGLWRREGAVSKTDIVCMCDRLVHRGPDGDGYYVQGSLGLGMRRLAIIDVEGGSQPIANEDDTIFLVFNGEIYNYVELHDELVRRGHRFKTRSDTETIVHAYEEYGFDCLKHFNGMFAFALWDSRQQRLWVCRDPLGEKPLYYRWDGETLIFASELKALQSAMDYDPEAVHHYLTFQHIPAPYSIYKQVRKLPAAHYLLLENEQLTIRRYWDLPFMPQWTDDSAVLQERLREEVRRAVNWRLRSDVPLGAFLSGGIDSAVVVALMAELLERPVEAFTIAFDDAAFDESGAARILAQHVGAHHTVESVRLDALNDLPRLLPYLDEPFADSSAIPTFYISRLARRHVTVALSGDGGDEVFGGYQRYSLDKLARLYGYVPSVIRTQVVDRIADRMDISRAVPIEANYALGLRRLKQVMATPDSASILRWGSFFTEAMKADLYQPDFKAETNSPDLLGQTFHRSDARSLTGRTLYTDTLHYLPDNGLVKTDRMSMANSLELRAPLIDVKLVEFAARLPDHFKVNGLKRKVLFKKAFADKLPPGWEKRPKRGFEVPVSLWMRDQLYEMAQDTLLNPQAATRAWFRPDAIQAMLSAHRARQEDHGRRLWALLILELWIQHANSAH